MSNLETKQKQYEYMQAILNACNAQFESVVDIKRKIIDEMRLDGNVYEQVVQAASLMELGGFRAQVDFLPMLASRIKRKSVLVHGEALTTEWQELQAKLKEDGITAEQEQDIKAQMQRCQMAASIYYDTINVDLIDPSTADYAAFANKAARALYDQMQDSLLGLI